MDKELYNDIMYDHIKDDLAERQYIREKMAKFKKGWKAAKKMRAFKPTINDIDCMIDKTLEEGQITLDYFKN